MSLPVYSPPYVSGPIFPPNTSSASAVSIVPNASFPSNSSQQSQVSNSSRKHLSRLFSKQRVPSSNVSRISQESDISDSMETESLNSQESFNTTAAPSISHSIARTNSHRKPTTSRLKSRLKLSSSNAVPDLKISTNSHSSLKVPKKILSANLTEDSKSLRRLSITSPTRPLHGLFHRNHTIPPDQADGAHSNLPVDDARALPARTAVTLSSNSSNSFITDVKLAMQYNFTNPDYVGGTEDADRDLDRDHPKLAEIHRKLMLPTDQYFQQKLTALPQKSENPSKGLGICIQGSEKLSISSDRHRFTRFFKVLLSTTKPLFIPSQYRRMPNGQYAPYLGCTLQEIACYVRTACVAEICPVPISYPRPSANLFSTPLGSSQSAAATIPLLAQFDSASATPSSSPALGQPRPANSKWARRELLDNYSVKQISQDLRAYFTRAMELLYNDQIESGRSQLDPHAANTETLLSALINLWTQIFHLYTLFNTRIRFTVLACLQPLQKHLHEQYSQQFYGQGDVGPCIEIENMLVLAFRDTVIIPNLSERSSLYFTARELDLSGSVAEEESAIFRTNSTLHRALIGCFGDIHSTTIGEPGNADGQQHIRNDVFAAAYNYISAIGLEE